MDMPPEKINIPESNKTDQGKPIRVLQVLASLDRGGAEYEKYGELSGTGVNVIRFLVYSVTPAMT